MAEEEALGSVGGLEHLPVHFGRIFLLYLLCTSEQVAPAAASLGRRCKITRNSFSTLFPLQGTPSKTQTGYYRKTREVTFRQ